MFIRLFRFSAAGMSELEVTQAIIATGEDIKEMRWDLFFCRLIQFTKFALFQDLESVETSEAVREAGIRVTCELALPTLFLFVSVVCHQTRQAVKYTDCLTLLHGSFNTQLFQMSHKSGLNLSCQGIRTSPPSRGQINVLTGLLHLWIHWACYLYHFGGKFWEQNHLNAFCPIPSIVQRK